MGVPFGGRQTSPLGSPQPMPSPGNPANEMAVSTYIPQSKQYKISNVQDAENSSWFLSKNVYFLVSESMGG